MLRYWVAVSGLEQGVRVMNVGVCVIYWVDTLCYDRVVN